MTALGKRESDKVIGAVKAWIAKKPAPEGADQAAIDRALDNLALNMLTDESPTAITRG